MLGQYEEALAYYNYGISKDPEASEIYLHRGLAQVSLHNFDKGIEDFLKALNNSPSGDTNKFKILLNLGINLRRVGHLKKSIEYLCKAVDLQPNKAQARNNLGLSLFENEEWDDAVTAYSHAINFET